MQVHDIHTHTPTEVKKKPEKSPEIGSEWVGEKTHPKVRLERNWMENEKITTNRAVEREQSVERSHANVCKWTKLMLVSDKYK